MVYSEPVTTPIRAFRNHLAHHLEQLALFVLPQKAMVKRDEGLLESLASSESQSISSENVARIDNHEGIDRELWDTEQDHIALETKAQTRELSSVAGEATDTDDIGSLHSEPLRRNHWVSRLFQRKPPTTVLSCTG